LVPTRREACVPLVLTRVAAVKDMPIYIYVLADGRAMPRNWFHVEINQRKLAWLQGGANYRPLVTSAINEAAGHGFVTEFAGTSSVMTNRLYAPDRNNLRTLQEAITAEQHIEALLNLSFPPAARNVLMNLLRKHFPLPAGALTPGPIDADIYSGYYNEPNRSLLNSIPFNHAALLEDLQSQVIEPLKREQAMLTSKSYLTRLFTTVSPDEMTRDPLFDFSRTLPPVSNALFAEATPYCSSGGDTNYVMTLPTGESYLADSTGAAFAKQPDSEHIALVGKNGTPVFYKPAESRTVDKWLDLEPAELVIQKGPPPGAAMQSAVRSPSNLDTAPVPGWVPPKAKVPGGGCSTTGRSRAGDWFTLGAVGLALWAARGKGEVEK